jgi:aromatic-L-amino-acid decarboxylase
MDYGVSLGRRMRALKLWFVLRYFGREGIIANLRHHVSLARTFAEHVEAGPGWRLAAPVPLSVVCFRYAPEGLGEDAADAANERILQRVNASGEAFMTHTRLLGRFVLRLAVGNLRSTEERVERTWALLRDAASAEETGSP